LGPGPQPRATINEGDERMSQRGSKSHRSIMRRLSKAATE